jgi:NADPH-dependent 2,4-dienoyl-CoA reductase/sulfur reductase-like enzyme
MTHRHRVVIVGASLAGVTTAEGLRNEGFDGEIVLLGDEPHPPYQRPPLSKQVLLGDWEPEQSILTTEQQLAGLGIEFRGSEAATGLDTGVRTVATASGTVPYDDVVIATGTRARPVRAASPVHTLRTIDDAFALRAALRGARRIAVLGAGILGSEIASAGRALGADVTLFGRSGVVTFGSVGGAMSARLEELHEQHGVRLRLDSEVDVAALTADLVVAAIGGLPNTEWLETSGLTLGNGVVSDHRGRAAPGVYAVGDVAVWADPVTGSAVRAEHQNNAIEQGMAVAATIVHDRPSAAPVPFFWSEIHGAKIMAYGRFDADRPLMTSDDSPPDRPLLLSSADDGRIRGVVAWNAQPRAFRAARALVDTHAESKEPR